MNITLTEIAKRAQNIRKTLGMRRAAGYLRNLDIAFEDALQLLGMPLRTWP